MSHPNGYNPNTLTFRDQSEDRPSRYILVGLGNWTEVGQRVWGAMDGRSGAIVDTRASHVAAVALVEALNDMHAKQLRVDAIFAEAVEAVDAIFADADAKIAALTEVMRGWHASAAAELREQEDAVNEAGTAQPLPDLAYRSFGNTN